jgi:hypothetical protein
MTTNLNVSSIDRAEALVLQLEALLVAMPDWDRLNLGVLLNTLGEAAGLRDDLMAERLETLHGYLGPGNRAEA